MKNNDKTFGFKFKFVGKIQIKAFGLEFVFFFSNTLFPKHSQRKMKKLESLKAQMNCFNILKRKINKNDGWS